MSDVKAFRFGRSSRRPLNRRPAKPISPRTILGLTSQRPDLRSFRVYRRFLRALRSDQGRGASGRGEVDGSSCGADEVHLRGCRIHARATRVSAMPRKVGPSAPRVAAVSIRVLDFRRRNTGSGSIIAALVMTGRHNCGIARRRRSDRSNLRRHYRPIPLGRGRQAHRRGNKIIQRQPCTATGRRG
jgi:hypothetical protein